MKCNSLGCEKEAVGEAYLPTKKREWASKCRQHLDELKAKGIDTRFYVGFEPINILCHTCMGTLFIEEIEYKTRNPVKVMCPECEGSGFVEYRKFRSSEQKVNEE